MTEQRGRRLYSQFLPALHRLYEAVFFHPKPVVAAINGHAIAGGCVLACCADRTDHGARGRPHRCDGNSRRRAVSLRWLSKSCGQPSRLGILPEFTLSGATYATDEALKRGWVDELAEPADLMDDAMAVAEELSLLSPAAFAQTKTQLRQPVVERLQASGKATDDAVIEIWAAPGTLAYIRDYVTRTLGKG